MYRQAAAAKLHFDWLLRLELEYAECPLRPLT
jgi:hypothetical protein